MPETQGATSSQGTSAPSLAGADAEVVDSSDPREPIAPRVFVFFADADADWVFGYLIDGLIGAGAEVITREDFRPGELRLNELERAVRRSTFTVLVLSEALAADALAGFVERLAASFSGESATWPVISIVRDGVALPTRIGLLTKLHASDPTLLAQVTKAIRMPPPPASQRPICPYPGMRTFSQSESKQFFGRRRETAEMVDQLNASRFITVIGPSGCGKSSLVFAGLLPAIAASARFSSGLDVRRMRPGADPVRSLHEAIGTPADEILLVVDQLEELFTTADSVSSIAFQRELLALGSNVFVVLTVRADFYEDLMVAPLWGRVKATRFEVMPLQGVALREAIDEPANGVGVYIESALVERLVNEADDEPGTLPLVQETLVALWDHLERRWLPLAAYEAFVLPATYERTVGIQVAMALRADASFGELGTEEQSVAHRQFIRLVNFGEGRRDTRRQQTIDTLRSADEDTSVFDRTLAHFVDRRLLTQTADESNVIVKVDLAHEALIRGWPRLSDWITEQRSAERTRRRLETAAEEWVRLGRGDGGLLDAPRLTEADDFLSSPAGLAVGHSCDLVSLVNVSRTRIADRSRRLRTLLRRTQIFAVASFVLFGAAAVGAGVARRQTSRARTAASLVRVQAAANLALREVNEFGDDVSALKAALVLVGHAGEVPPVADEVLRSSLYETRNFTRTYTTPLGAASPHNCWDNLATLTHESVSFDRSGQFVAALSAANGLRRWRVDSPAPPTMTNAVAPPAGFTTGGRFAITLCPSQVGITDTLVMGSTSFFAIGNEGLSSENVFVDVSDDGSTLAQGIVGGSITIRRPGERQLPVTITLGLDAGDKFKDVALSRDGRRVFAWGDHRIWMWSLADDGARAVGEIARESNLTSAPVVSDDSEYIIVADESGVSVESSDRSSAGRTPAGSVRLPGSDPLDRGARVVAVSADGQHVAASVSAAPSIVQLWERVGSSWTEKPVVRLREPAQGLALNERGDRLAAVSPRGTVRVVDLHVSALATAGLFTGPSGPLGSLAVSPSGERASARRRADSTQIHWATNRPGQAPSLVAGALQGAQVPRSARLTVDDVDVMLVTDGGSHPSVSVVEVRDGRTPTHREVGRVSATVESGSTTDDGRFCVVDDGGGVYLSTDGRDALRGVLESLRLDTTGAVLSPDCRWVLIGRGSDSATALKLYSTENPGKMLDLDVPGAFTSVAFDRLGHLVALGYKGGIVRLLELTGTQAGKARLLERHVADQDLTALAFRNDSRELAIGDSTGTLSIVTLPLPRAWSATTVLALRRSARMGRSTLDHMAWDSNGSVLAGFESGEIFTMRPTTELAEPLCVAAWGDHLLADLTLDATLETEAVSCVRMEKHA